MKGWRMEDNIDLSIIIISYNTRELTLRCLQTVFESLSGSSISYEAIVIDNASTDDSSARIQKKFPQVKLVQNEKNMGFGQANNQGVELAKGKVVLLLNSDIEVIDNAIEKLYQFFVTLPQKSIVGGKLFNTDKTAQPSAGPAYTLPMIFASLFLKGDYINITRYSPNKIRETDWVMGACMMFDRNAFLESGGFDTGIFMYMEEIDWQHRIKKEGYKVYFYPEAHFIHVGAGSSQGRKFPILNVYRGFLYFYKKHYSLLHVSLLRVILLLKALIAVVLFTFMNRKSDRNIYIEAIKIAIS